MLLEASLQVLGDSLETLGAQSEMVLPVGVAAEGTREPLIPARALDAGQEMARNHREQLQKDTKCFKNYRILYNKELTFAEAYFRDANSATYNLVSDLV